MTSQPTFPGTLLREKREALGCSLPDLYEHIHVPAQYIDALESGRLHDLPSPTYVLGYINTYCEFLGLDARPFVERYRACTRPGEPPVRHRTVPVIRIPGQRPAWLDSAITWGAICAILCLGWFAYSVVVKPMAEPPATPLEAGTIEAAPATHFDELGL